MDVAKLNCLIKAAAEGNTSDVRLLITLTEPQPYYVHALCAAAEHGHLECLKLLDSAWPSTSGRERSLAAAVKGNRMDCVEYVLNVFNQPFDNSLALLAAAKTANYAVVTMLLPHCLPHGCESEALRQSIIDNDAKLFDLLLPATDLKNTRALIAAIEYNRIDFFKILLPLCDHTANDHLAFRTAVDLEHTEFAKILYPLTNINSILQDFNDDFGINTNHFHQKLLILEAKMQHDVLRKSVSNHHSVGVSRKI